MLLLLISLAGWGQPTVTFTAAEIAAIPLVAPRAGTPVRKVLFDGKTLRGWKGNLEWWSVADGAILGKHSDKVPTNFLFTEGEYTDFRLTLESKMVESDNHAGVAFWGEIATKGENRWYTQGPLVVFPRPSMWDYIEARGLRVFKTPGVAAPGQHEWIRVEILAQGNRVRTALNGVPVMEWREPDGRRVKAGPIGLQLHAWPSAQEVLYRNIVIETFPRVSELLGK